MRLALKKYYFFFFTSENFFCIRIFFRTNLKKMGVVLILFWSTFSLAQSENEINSPNIEIVKKTLESFESPFLNSYVILQANKICPLFYDWNKTFNSESEEKSKKIPLFTFLKMLDEEIQDPSKVFTDFNSKNKTSGPIETILDYYKSLFDSDISPLELENKKTEYHNQMVQFEGDLYPPYVIRFEILTDLIKYVNIDRVKAFIDYLEMNFKESATSYLDEMIINHEVPDVHSLYQRYETQNWNYLRDFYEAFNSDNSLLRQNAKPSEVLSYFTNKLDHVYNRIFIKELEDARWNQINKALLPVQTFYLGGVNSKAKIKEGLFYLKGLLAELFDRIQILEREAINLSEDVSVELGALDMLYHKYDLLVYKFENLVQQPWREICNDYFETRKNASMVFSSQYLVCEDERKEIVKEINANILSVLRSKENNKNKEFLILNVIRKRDKFCLMGGNYQLKFKYSDDRTKVWIQISSVEDQIVYERMLQLENDFYNKQLRLYPIFSSEEILNILNPRKHSL